MERRVRGNLHARCGAGEKVEITSKPYLSLSWRPRDLEQRAGRIERRGNKNSEVEIYRYVTEGTFDAYSYQIIENKQRGISQVFTSKSPVRVMQEVDAAALSYAEIKALATGNPLIIERCNLEAEVSKLTMLKSNHLSQKYELEDAILKLYPSQIAAGEERLRAYAADIKVVEAHTPTDEDVFPPMKIGGNIFTEKKDAGIAIIDACKAMTSPEPVPLGEYRGFTMELSFNTFSKEYVISFKGALTHTVTLGSDIHGNITRLDNVLDGLAAKQKQCEEQLAKTHEQLAAAKEAVNVPFPREAELAEKSARLSELTIALKMNEKDRDDIDDAPDEGEVAPRRARSEVAMAR